MSSENFSLKPVPQHERKGAVALTFVMLGLTFFSASMWTGGTLGTSLTYHDFWLAVIIGNLMLGIYTSFLGYIGAKTGLTTHVLARYSFGVKGSWLPSLILGGTQVGWFGVGVAMFTLAISIVFNMVLVYLVLRYVSILDRLLGANGVYILRKFFGVVLLAISVKFITKNLIDVIAMVERGVANHGG